MASRCRHDPTKFSPILDAGPQGKASPATMASIQKDLRIKPSKRRSRPILTVDTEAPKKMSTGDQALRSAPVGTRQDKGIPPMYQAVDRHCEKLAEMMNSPTWRSQNPGAHLVKPAVKPTVTVASHDRHSPPSSEEEIYDDQHGDGDLDGDPLTVYLASSPSSVTTLVDEAQLDRDTEVVRLVGLHPFLKTPGGTYILSAAASPSAISSRDALYGEMRRVRVLRKRTSTWTEANGPKGRLAGEITEDSENDCESHFRTASHSNELSNDKFLTTKTMNEDLDNNARDLMNQDGGIRSINHTFRPEHRPGQAASPDEKQRFGGILERLRQQCAAALSPTSPSPEEPTSAASASTAGDSANVSKRREHVRSDSGYASQRIGRGSSESTAPDCFKIQHWKSESNGAVSESPSKSPALNPAAKEFSAEGKFGLPMKPNVFARPSIYSKLWLPPPQVPGMGGVSPPSMNSPILNPIQAPWNGPLTNGSSPLTSFGAMQSNISPELPSVPPLLGDFPRSAIPPPPGLGFPGTMSPRAPIPGFTASSCQPCVHGLVPGLAATCYQSPFHQQLPSMMTCNNPSHQVFPAFHPPALGAGMPSTIIPQGPASNCPMHIAPRAQPSPGTAQLPKHVPKPKVPNTTGQQNWELMHELRRTLEPGYAQKCKEKQKKRYLKQLEKTGGSGA